MENTNIGEEITLMACFKKQVYESEDYTFRIIIANGGNKKENKFPPKMDSGADFMAKGNFAAPEYPDQPIEMVGEWRYDTKYKTYSFAVSYIIPTLPKNEKDSMCFLKTIKGIGKTLAERICKEYDGDLEAAAQDEELLVATVKGMSVNKAKEVCARIKQINASVELTKLLKNIVPGEVIKKITAKYGTKALEMVTNNPYKMVEDRAISFSEADTIALAMGRSKTDEERIRFAIISSIRAIKARTAAIVVLKTELDKIVSQKLSINNAFISVVMDKMFSNRELISAKNYCYLVDDYKTEKVLADKIVKYVNSEIPPMDIQKYLQSFEDWKQNNGKIALAEQQEEAVKAVAENHLSVLTGGPGTGKTATLKAIMETYRAAFPGSNITLMAPTGLASKRMAEACGMDAQTIHKTLGLIPSECDAGFDDANGLSIDGGLIIVDEFSMVGIHLAKFLFDNIVFKPDTRIVIVGDIDQLPPVSPGAVLDDLISCREVKVTRLTKNFRQEAGSPIIDGAYAVNAGDNNLKFTGNFQYQSIENRDIDIETKDILEEIKKAFANSIKQYGLVNTFVLCPMRKSEKDKDGNITTKTLLSTSSLNPILRDIANPMAPGKNFYKSGSRLFREGDRVINLKNTEDALNGEIGFIRKIDTEDVPVITVDFSGELVEFTADKVKHLDLAYCITVHKSQGCEYQSVIYPASMTQAAMLQRNLLYTAITRAKKNFLVIGNRNAIKKSVVTVKDKTKKDFLAARISVGANPDILKQLQGKN